VERPPFPGSSVISRSSAASVRPTDSAATLAMKDLLSFLIARDSMHQQQWLAAIEELGDHDGIAPNDVPDDPDHEQYAYAFFGHAEELMEAPASVHAGIEATRAAGDGDGMAEKAKGAIKDTVNKLT
jgi:Mn-containing catalase